MFAVSLAVAMEKHIPDAMPIKEIAYASFFAYLLHRVVYKVMTELWTPHDVAYFVAWLALGAVLTFVLAWVGQKLYDALMRRLYRPGGRRAAIATRPNGLMQD